MRIIVSLTSWPKRIATSIKTIDSILNQTLKADLIELNLSIEEFKNKENDLPVELQKYINKGLIEVNWVNRNTKTFKKIIPTLKKFYGEEYYLLSIDDDCIYRCDYIEIMVSYIKKNNSDSFCLANANVCGNRNIYNSLAFEKDFWEKLNDNIIQYGIDDYYTEYYLKSKNKKMSGHRPDDVTDMIKVHDEIEPLHDFYRIEDRVNKAITETKKIKF